MKSAMELLLDKNEIHSKSFKDFKKNFFVRKPIDFVKITEKQTKDIFFSITLVDLFLFGIWVAVTQSLIIKQEIVDKGVHKYFPENENLLLINTVEYECDHLELLFRKLSELKYQTDFNENDFEYLAGEVSRKIFILVELLFFRQFLVHNFSNLQDFNFSQFNYVQLVILFDANLYLFSSKIFEFCIKFSETYKLKKIIKTHENA